MRIDHLVHPKTKLERVRAAGTLIMCFAAGAFIVSTILYTFGIATALEWEILGGILAVAAGSCVSKPR
jgi:hypothetical protein